VSGEGVPGGNSFRSPHPPRGVGKGVPGGHPAAPRSDRYKKDRMDQPGRVSISSSAQGDCRGTVPTGEDFFRGVVSWQGWEIPLLERGPDRDVPKDGRVVETRGPGPFHLSLHGKSGGVGKGFWLGTEE